jgi:HK97 family phage major capsid protein
LERQELDDLRSIPDLVAYQREVQDRLTEINNEHAGLPLPDEERAEFAGLTAQNDEIDKRVRELEARHAMIERLAQDPKAVEREVTELDRQMNSRDARGSAAERDIYDLSSMRINPYEPDRMRDQYRDRAMRAIEAAHFPARTADGRPLDRARAQEHIEHLMRSTQEGEPGAANPGAVARHILTTGSPTYRRAFWKQLSGAVLSREEQRALSLGGSGGGFAIPFALDPTLIPISNSVVNPARALARIETIAGANTWIGVTSAAVTASRVAELTEVTDTAGTPLLQPSLTVTKAHAFVPFSIEVGEDWPALESQFTMLIGQAKDDEEATAFVTGSGSGVNPQGFVVGATGNVAASTGLTVTAANVYALEAALPPRFRPNESFVANRGIYNVIRAIDTAGGAALWLYMSMGLDTQAPRPGNTGATILGRGAWEASAMQATVVNATKIMVVGDFNYFLIVDRIGMTVELIPHIFGATARFPIGQRGLYAYWRNTSRVLAGSAFVTLTGTT